MTAVDKLIAVAEAELGYLEKKSNKDLDDKTANAGDKNYTKYNRDLKEWTGVGSVSYQWCQAFVDWCFITAFGLADAKKLIYTWTNYTPTGSSAFKKKGRYVKRGEGKPNRGDVIYFYNKDKGRIGHVGIVYKVTSTKVYTIEGNTSGASELVVNGGGVKKKSYSLTSTYIDGYGLVDYSQISDEPGVLKNGSIGQEVKEMQEMLLEYDKKSLPKYGADGEFGNETETAVKSFQKKKGLEATGVYDEKTKKALEEAVKAPVEEPKKTYHIEIINGSVNIRNSYGVDGTKILGIGKVGETYKYLEKSHQIGDITWYNISYKDGTAWVSGRYSKVVEDGH